MESSLHESFADKGRPLGQSKYKQNVQVFPTFCTKMRNTLAQSVLRRNDAVSVLPLFPPVASAFASYCKSSAASVIHPNAAVIIAPAVAFCAR
jgi:hypothetical protein